MLSAVVNVYRRNHILPFFCLSRYLISQTAEQKLVLEVCSKYSEINLSLTSSGCSLVVSTYEQDNEFVICIHDGEFGDQLNYYFLLNKDCALWKQLILYFKPNQILIFLTHVVGPKRVGVTAGWRKLHNEELHTHQTLLRLLYQGG
jgi:hypothetical protein